MTKLERFYKRQIKNKYKEQHRTVVNACNCILENAKKRIEAEKLNKDNK